MLFSQNIILSPHTWNPPAHYRDIEVVETAVMPHSPAKRQNFLTTGKQHYSALRHSALENRKEERDSRQVPPIA